MDYNTAGTNRNDSIGRASYLALRRPSDFRESRLLTERLTGFAA